jgi:outer membrane protein assembly factor BamD (BamD/ComL family)
MQLRIGVVVAVLLCFTAGAETVRGTPIRVCSIYLSPDITSNKLADIDRGREVVILESNRDWLHVEAALTEEKVVTGWMLNKGVVQGSTPDGDKIVFGEGVDSEDQASQRHGRRGAAQDAMRLYYRTAEYFPNSPLAAEGMYRSADIRWQIDKADVMSRPSAKEKEAYLREGMPEDFMKEVIKKFPGTKWADLAAFHLIENKLCGDWQGSSKCPDKEAEMYEKYVADHPQSPALVEALYDAASRRAALIEMYKTDGQNKKSDESRVKAIALAQKAVAQGPQSDWGTRAQLLLFMIEQGIPTYGNGGN